MLIKIKDNIINTDELITVRCCKTMYNMQSVPTVQILFKNSATTNVICNSEKESKELLEEIWRDI